MLSRSSEESSAGGWGGGRTSVRGPTRVVGGLWKKLGYSEGEGSKLRTGVVGRGITDLVKS